MKISLRARQITDADISLISLVKRGATRAPFKILKVDEKEDAVTEREIRKQQPAVPAGVMEQLHDTPAQQADRVRIANQYRLERKVELLTRKLEDTWDAGNAEREKRLTQQIEDATLELESLRDPGTRVVKTEAGYELVKLNEGYSDAFAHRGGQSFQHDSTDDLSDIDGSIGTHQGPNAANIVKDDEIDLGSPFASLESASRAVRGSRQDFARRGPR